LSSSEDEQAEAKLIRITENRNGMCIFFISPAFTIERCGI